MRMVFAAEVVASSLVVPVPRQTVTVVQEVGLHTCSSQCTLSSLLPTSTAFSCISCSSTSCWRKGSPPRLATPSLGDHYLVL